MAFKFPFTNYHELNLTWVLEQLKKLFEESEENVETIEGYEDRLSAVETEVTDLESTTTQAINTANAAATNAATALSRANTANQNALTASSQAGAAVTAAQESQQEAQAATQAAQQAQATAMTFDGRITQAQNDASAAVHEAESFENRVNAAINTANNAANTATIAQGIAVNANQTAAQALDELNAQREELVSISEEQQEAIEAVGASVIESIPADYQTTVEAVKKKAPVIVSSAQGEVVSFSDGADDMEIQKLIVSFNPIQNGSGTPTPNNIIPLLSRTGLNVATSGENMANPATFSLNRVTEENGIYTANDGDTASSLILKIQQYSGGTVISGVQTAVIVTPQRIRLSLILSPSATRVKFANNGVVREFSVFIPVDPAICGKTITFSADIIDVTLGACKFKNIQIQPGIVTTPMFVPYVGNTSNSISWENEAGAIYGGNIDVISGELKDNTTRIKLNSLEWTYVSARNQFIGEGASLENTPEPSAAGVPNCFAEAFTNYYTGSTIGIYNIPENNFCLNITSLSSRRRLVFKTSLYSSLQDFLTAVGETYVVVPVVTGENYQIQPRTIKTFYGVNDVYSDGGPVSVDYPTDTKLYIDGKFTELQALVLEN